MPKRLQNTNLSCRRCSQSIANYMLKIANVSRQTPITTRRLVVLAKAEAYGVPAVVFSKEELANGSVLGQINEVGPSLIVLAGFLLKFPADIIEAYPHKVINIHPALLPKYGGKGMYGLNVHRAVHQNKDKESGITIHYVNNDYDEGSIIFQKAVAIEECLSPEEVALKVLALEHEHFPKVIEQLVNGSI